MEAPNTNETMEQQPEEVKASKPATIIIGPNTLPRSASGGGYRRRGAAQRETEGNAIDYDYDDGDEIDEDEFEGMMLNGGGGFYGGDDFFPPTTWDLIIKNVTPKLPALEQVLSKYQLKSRKFFIAQNEYQYNPPFLVFYQRPESVPDTLNQANFNEHLLIPHQFELMRFFESFHMLKFPKEPILMLKRQCKIFQILKLASFHRTV